MGNGIDKPLAYELGEWDFYDLTLKITPDVLIPRPDTEILVEVALAFLKGKPRVLDLCCGSGCVGLAVAKHSSAVVTYADISEAALDVARCNGAEDARVIDALKPPPDGFPLFDALLCNPPYVMTDDPALDASVLDWEPHIALFGGADGLDFYRSLFANWLCVIKPGGLFAVEVGYDQADAVSQMAREAGLLNVTVRKDYAGVERVVSGYTV